MPKTLPRQPTKQSATVPPNPPKAPEPKPGEVPLDKRVPLPDHVVKQLLSHLHKMLYPIVPEGGNAGAMILEERSKAIGAIESASRFLGVADENGNCAINLAERWLAKVTDVKG